MMLANTLHVFAGILYQILYVIYLAWLFYFLLSFYCMKKERHLIINLVCKSKYRFFRCLEDIGGLVFFHLWNFYAKCSSDIDLEDAWRQMCS